MKLNLSALVPSDNCASDTAIRRQSTHLFGATYPFDSEALSSLVRRTIAGHLRLVLPF